MSEALTAFCRQPRYLLSRARIPDCLLSGLAVEANVEGLVETDILIEGDRIAAVQSENDADCPRWDLRGAMVLPCFVDAHTHIDKGHIWPRRANPDGTFQGDTTVNWNEPMLVINRSQKAFTVTGKDNLKRLYNFHRMASNVTLPLRNGGLKHVPVWPYR